MAPAGGPALVMHPLVLFVGLLGLRLGDPLLGEVRVRVRFRVRVRVRLNGQGQGQWSGSMVRVRVNG